MGSRKKTFKQNKLTSIDGNYWRVIKLHLRLAANIKKPIQELAPAYFALVMSTGIVSIAFSLFKFTAISNILFYLNNVEYLVLIILLVGRVALFFPAFETDFATHKKGPGFFTLIAGTNILGVQYMLLKQMAQPAIFLWIVGIVLWVAVMYDFLFTIITKKQDPPLAEGINGIWLLVVVATQSISVLGSLVSPRLLIPKDITIFICTSFFVLGIMLYIILITMIFYRLTFFPIDPKDFSPPFWIMTGAFSITTLAGATLVKQVTSTALSDIQPFIKGLSLFAWSTASFFIPLLIMLEVWRHIIRRVQVKYQPEYWAMVFSLGMYTVCTYRLAEALQTNFLKAVPKAFIFIAAAAWLITFIGMLVNVARALSPKSKVVNIDSRVR
jgi:tellurite resistance protein TehA-like permease